MAGSKETPEQGRRRTGQQQGEPPPPHQQEHGSGGEREGSGGSGGGSRGQSDSGEKRKGEEKDEPSRAEWVVGIASSLVVLLAVGYLFQQALTRPSLPPLVRVEVERVRPMASGYLVEIRAVNEGSQTAANLMVEGTLSQDTATVERSNATIDFVPGETERQGGLFFTRDPRRYRLEVRPTGYDRP